MKIVFAIPTWNRLDQLKLTLQQLLAASRSCAIDVLISISDNHSTDGTGEYIEKLQADNDIIKVCRPVAHVGGMENYNFVLGESLRYCNEGDYLWSFGDDDDISINSLDSVARAIIEHRPYFASVGNIKLPPHTGKVYSGSAADISNQLGFFLSFGFISQCIFSVPLVRRLFDDKLMINRFRGDSYSHGTSVLLLSEARVVIHIDQPISTWRKYSSQQEETAKRWGDEGVYDGIFGFVDSIGELIEERVLPAKLGLQFFRYWRWHFWDFLLYHASMLTLSNPTLIHSPKWDKIYKMAGYLRDLECAKRLVINADLQRIALARCPQDKAVHLVLRKYESTPVYFEFLGSAPVR